jgi:hypothetical protein
MKTRIIFLAVFCLFLIPALSEAQEQLLLCGAEQSGTVGSMGEMVYEISVPAGIHLIVEMDNPSNYSRLYIKYGSIPEQSCPPDDDCDGFYDASVEILNTQAGTYYVLVRNTSGGIVDYTINAYDTSCPKRSITPCGATKNGSMARNGEDIWQIKVPAGIHLIVDMITTYLSSDLYIRYGQIPEQSCPPDDDCDEGNGDASVEILNTQAGFYYVLVDSDGNLIMDYTINAFSSDCSGLDVDIILNQTEFTTGDTLNVQARIINNESTPYNVEVKHWIKTHDGYLLPILGDNHLTIDIAPESDNTYTTFTYPFNNPVPAEEYEVEIKLVNPITVDYYTRDKDTFNFVLP